MYSSAHTGWLFQRSASATVLHHPPGAFHSAAYFAVVQSPDRRAVLRLPTLPGLVRRPPAAGRVKSSFFKALLSGWHCPKRGLPPVFFVAGSPSRALSICAPGFYPDRCIPFSSGSMSCSLTPTLTVLSWLNNTSASRSLLMISSGEYRLREIFSLLLL